MRKFFKFTAIIFILIVIISIAYYFLIFQPSKEKARPAPGVLRSPPVSDTQKIGQEIIHLPEPKLSGPISLEEAIKERRSRREFSQEPLTLEHVAQILWSAQGITDKVKGFRAAPSAGALYPLDIYIVVSENGVKGVKAGVYHFNPEEFVLEKVLTSEVRSDLMAACLSQEAVAEAPVNLVITAEYERTMQKYGERGRHYVYLEAGHAAQNIYLQIETLGLGTVSIGAFSDSGVGQILQLPEEYQPLYVMPIGHRR